MDLAKVRQWDVVALDRLEQSLSARIVTCDDVRDRLADIGRLPGWHDDAAVAARVRFQVTADQLLDEVAAIGAVRRVTRETSVAVTHLKKELEAIEDLAATNRMTVSDVGDVTDLPGPPADADEAKARETVRDELRAAARAIIFQAEDIDNDAASVLKRAARGEIDDRGAVDVDAAAAAGEQQGGLTAPSPPGDASSIENREYWDAMDEPQRRDVIEKHPEWVGNRDGIPADVRHEANVNRIDDERTRLEAERSRLQDELDGNLFGGTFTDDDAAHWYTEQKLKDLDKIESILDENPDGLLLLLDMQSGERGMVAFSVGNPDTADHVAVTVPGFNSNIEDSLGGMVGEAESSTMRQEYNS
ncbi:MAG: alpha/beta hydrolase [Rhodococcus sp. (in: high G+C Gram-positive bacteria)]|uniref:alpha/beta hydrolase n=1 Tax=Rhodococcus sp. TaxID=1831 RepID=UPI003BAFAFE6